MLLTGSPLLHIILLHVFWTDISLFLMSFRDIDFSNLLSCIHGTLFFLIFWVVFILIMYEASTLSKKKNPLISLDLP